MKNIATTTQTDISASEATTLPNLPPKSAELLANAGFLQRYSEECYVVVDTNLAIMSFSHNFAHACQWAYGKDVKTGNSIIDYQPAEKADEIRKLYERALQNEAFEIELDVTTTNAQTLTTLNKYKPIHNDTGQIIGAFVSSVNITSTKKAENEIHKHERKYKSLIENSLDAFFFTTHDGLILDINNAATAMFGYTIEEFRKLNRSDLVVFTDEELEQYQTERGRNGKMKGEATGKRKNGELFTFEFSSILYNDGSDQIKFGTFIRDISARKNAEKIIALNEKRFRALVENAGDIIILSSADGIVTYVSPAYEKITGFSAAEVVGYTNLQLAHPEQAKETLVFFEHLIKTPGKAMPRLNRLRHKDGHYIWVEGYLTNLLHDESVQAIVSNYHDITERIQAAEDLRQSENNLKTIFENTSEAFLLLDTNRIVKAFNSSAKKIGFLNGDLEVKVGFDALNFTADARREMVIGLFERVIKGEEIQYDRAFELENGKQLWYTFSIKPVIENGRITGACMNGRDITERKLIYEELRKRELRFRTILKNSHDILFLFDADGKIEFMSPGIEKLFGFIKENDEIQHLLDNIHPDDLENAVQQLRLAFMSPDVPIALTLRKQKKDGTFVWLEGTFTNMLHIPEVKVMVANFRDITERKLFEEQQALLGSIVNSSDDAIMSINLDTTIITWNKGAEKLYGYKAHEVIGQSSYMIIPTDRNNEEAELMRKIQRGESVNHYETQRIRKNKKLVDVSLTLSPIRDSKGNITGASKIARDISDKKRAADIIKNNERRFRSLLQNSNDGLTLMTVEGIMLEVSPAGQKITGFTEAEMVGHSRFDLIHPDDLNHVMEAFINVIENPEKTENFEYRSLTIDGTYKWLDACCQNMLNDPAVTAIVINYRDITERKNQELEREKLIKTLNQKNNDLRNFSYITSHNLKAPLSNLMGFLELLEDIPIEDPTLRNILDGFGASTAQLNQTINDLVQILIIRDSYSVEQKEVSFEKVFTQVKNQLRRQIKEARPLIQTDFRHAPTVVFNQTYLESIFLNLLTNAIRYRDYERPLEINVSTQVQDNAIVLRFTDNGIGIDTELHKTKLFGLYQRFHNRPDSKGLGLYLIKSQMESLQGSISVESTVDVGTTFVLSFAVDGVIKL